GTAICFEATRPDHLRGLKNGGASVFVQISNELWFGPTSAARQMMAAAIFRAAENNVEMIRATNSGLSALIDRHGVVHDDTPMMETATRVWKMETAAREATLYTRWGDWFAITAATLTLVLLAATFVPERREETKR
ncbi:MAG TPA: nitrilase-related carbon-nitrogen hydrolase, partial [Blastocatellia bacterium]|nr:nitrilase-related carbon-nitrogen hydrolase [Blastocatellia bacterium]